MSLRYTAWLTTFRSQTATLSNMNAAGDLRNRDFMLRLTRYTTN